MNESISNLYSWEHARDEADEMQRILKFGKLLLSYQNDYDAASRIAEDLVEKKRQAIEVPIDREAYEMQHHALRRYLDTPRESDERDGLREELAEAVRFQNEQSKPLVEEWTEEVYRGVHGAGTLTHVVDESGRLVLKRAIPFYHP